MVKLARCYETGEGVRKKDQSKAATWYRRGADAGDPDGMLEMARIYQDGVGVDKSPVEAYKWYLLAAKYADGQEAEEAKIAAVKARTMIATRLSNAERQQAMSEAETWRPFVPPTYGRPDQDRPMYYDEQ